MKRIEKGPVRGISFKLQEEERERKDNYVPDQSTVNTSRIEVDPETKSMLKAIGFGNLRLVSSLSCQSSRFLSFPQTTNQCRSCEATPSHRQQQQQPPPPSKKNLSVYNNSSLRSRQCIKIFFPSPSACAPFEVVLGFPRPPEKQTTTFIYTEAYKKSSLSPTPRRSCVASLGRSGRDRLDFCLIFIHAYFSHRIVFRLHG